jgi:lipoprotein NlpI
MVSYVLITALLLPSPVARQQEADDLLGSALTAFGADDFKTALALTDKALALAPKRADAWLLRGSCHDNLGNFTAAVCDFTHCLEIDPKKAMAWQHRGAAHFKLGKIDESIHDFDAYLQLRPDQTPHHWQRGISYYYAGRFDEGRDQFKGYEDVDANDVENAVWHYMCVARKDGVEKARAGLLKIGKDKRVPMMEVYALFAGKATPADVLKAAQAPATPEKLELQQFYAHLYLGLYYEVHGDAKKALAHLEQAVEHRVNGYMWEVARVHRDLRKK